VFEAILNPSEEQVKYAFRMHCFIVEERDKRIKARVVADGQNQAQYMEEETYSLTV
jgi:hypothetical protein